ncbi:RNA polymerase sigma factor SigC [Mycobacterium sp. 050134]|uniref:RNA polymerase sigma factor SigC n=1 Tax=Mycobacterium sp. 050134 TaxID=3096111 RepID=UPI002ED92BE3
MATCGDDDQITQLAKLAGRGDRAALSEFVRATQRDVWRLVAYLADPGSADDLTQETFLRAIGALPRFAGRSSARTWLLSIARRVVVDQIRYDTSRPRLAFVADVDDAFGHGRRGSRIENVVEIRVLLDGLDAKRREALVLTQLLGLSYAEAAEVCGCPIGTVRSRVARARDDLLHAVDASDCAG